MGETKEKILCAALRLFGQNGYEAVSVSQIAGELGMTKGALYRHYQSKRDIFEQILVYMETLDAQRARRFQLPEGTLRVMAERYRGATMEGLLAFSRAQFDYWTREELPACFRRMLTLEQYRGAEMAALYRQYLADGPLGYITDLFGAWGVAEARRAAVEFYAPMFLFYSLYDGAQDKNAVSEALYAHLERFAVRLEQQPTFE